MGKTKISLKAIEKAVETMNDCHGDGYPLIYDPIKVTVGPDDEIIVDVTAEYHINLEHAEASECRAYARELEEIAELVEPFEGRFKVDKNAEVDDKDLAYIRESVSFMLMYGDDIADWLEEQYAE